MDDTKFDYVEDDKVFCLPRLLSEEEVVPDWWKPCHCNDCVRENYLKNKRENYKE